MLEQKLAVIFAEFGIDKTGDVLDSAQAGEIFEDLFMDVIIDPESVEHAVDQTVSRIRNGIQEIRENSAIYDLSEDLDVHDAALLRDHPLPHWVEKMTTAFLNSHGGQAIRKKQWWDLRWPDGDIFKKQVFLTRDAEKYRGTTLLNLENNRVRKLALQLPQTAAGEFFPQLCLEGLPAGIKGYWGLFEIRLQVENVRPSKLLRMPLLRRKFLPVFISDDGKVFQSTARHIWDTLYTSELQVSCQSVGSSASIFDDLMAVAEQSGQDLFYALQSEHLDAVAKEGDRARYFFAVRRKAIERVGLIEVRNYRLANLEKEEKEWRQAIETARRIIPEIRPLLLLGISGESSS